MTVLTYGNQAPGADRLSMGSGACAEGRSRVCSAFSSYATDPWKLVVVVADCKQSISFGIRSVGAERSLYAARRYFRVHFTNVYGGRPRCALLINQRSIMISTCSLCVGVWVCVSAHMHPSVKVYVVPS